MASFTFFLFFLEIWRLCALFPRKKILWTVCSTPPSSHPYIWSPSVHNFATKKQKKKPHWRWCSPPLATHVFFSIIIFFQRSSNTREEPGLGQVFEEDHLKAHEFCKRNANAKSTRLSSWRRRRICLFSRDPAASWCIFRVSFQL